MILADWKKLAQQGGSTPKRPYRFGVQDISRATGRSLWAIRKDRHRGKLDPTDLVSLSEYVVRYRHTAGQ